MPNDEVFQTHVPVATAEVVPAAATPPESHATKDAGDRDTHDASADSAGLSENRNPISLPLAAFPILAILGIAIAGELAGPVWAIVVAALCLTAVGMWVARIMESSRTVLLTATVGIALTTGAIIYYSIAESDPFISFQWQDPPGVVSNLGGVDLSGSNLRLVDLRGANLRAVDLSGACLRAADLRGADLTETIFTGADLSGTLVDGDKQVSVARDWPAAPPSPSPCDN